MKTLKHQTLIYDDDCPLCQGYTSYFIKTGMLDTEGRTAYSDYAKSNYATINMHRAANEIALVDHKSKTVTYGIDSLLKVLGHNFPWISTIGNIKVVRIGLNWLYSFISYNRKVIIPNRQDSTNKVECNPSFNYSFRTQFMIFSVVITTYILNTYSNFLPVSFTSLTNEAVIIIGQLLFQGLFLIRHDLKTLVNYFGHLMTVSLMGSLLLAPILFLSSLIDIGNSLPTIWFGMTVLLMFLEHARRVKLLQLPKYLSYTWFLYRLILLGIIIQLAI